MVHARLRIGAHIMLPVEIGILHDATMQIDMGTYDAAHHDGKALLPESIPDDAPWKSLFQADLIAVQARCDDIARVLVCSGEFARLSVEGDINDLVDVIAGDLLLALGKTLLGSEPYSFDWEPRSLRRFFARV